MIRRRMMKKFLLYMVLCALGSNGYAAEPLKICGHSDYPPFMWQHKGRTVGLASEMVQWCDKYVTLYAAAPVE
jgi:hypothetical protein